MRGRGGGGGEDILNRDKHNSYCGYDVNVYMQNLDNYNIKSESVHLIEPIRLEEFHDF